MIVQYILDDDGKPVPEPNPLKWAMWMATSEQRVVASDYIGKIHVSTIFLGLDYNRPLDAMLRDALNGIPPDRNDTYFFETMIFGDDTLDGYQRRYKTRDEAVAGHQAALAAVRAKWN